MQRSIFLPAAVALVALAACSETPTTTLVADPSLAAAKPGPDEGGSPHFLYVDYDASLLELNNHFKQAGLGSFQSVSYLLSAAGAEVTYYCLNNPEGGPSPSAKPHSGTIGAVTSSGTFPVRGGSVVGDLSLTLPANSVSCQATGLHEYISAVKWLGVRFRWGDLQIDGPVPANGAPGPQDVQGPGSWSF